MGKSKVLFLILLSLSVLCAFCYSACGNTEETYYTVVFVLDQQVSVNVKKNEKIVESDIPDARKDGYEFSGWYLDGVKFDFDTKIIDNITLIPQYKSLNEISLTEYNGQPISVLPDAMKNYLDCKTESAIAEYLYTYHANYVQADSAKPIGLNWSCTFSEPCIVYISSNVNFSDDVYEFETENTFITVYNLIPNTYYWKVVSESGAESQTDSFVIADTVRAINCGNVMNMRDEGGYIGEFGKIRYGSVYRTEDITKADDTAVSVLVNDLKIKTEIDLRTNGSSFSAPSDTIRKENYGICQYWRIYPDHPDFAEGSSFDAECADNLNKAFKLLTDESNYPLVFHCSEGADKTGTFAFLLSGLLGVSYEDIARDYEMTSFYETRRWRNGIKRGAIYSFYDNDSDYWTAVDFRKMYNYMMETYGAGDGKLYSAVENYLYTVVGLNKTDIENIRSILIDSYEREIIVGEDRIFDGKDITFADATFSDIKSVKLSGTVVTASNYELSENRITVKAAAFDALKGFEHYIEVEFGENKIYSANILKYNCISSIDDFNKIKNDPYGYFILTHDIDALDVKIDNLFTANWWAVPNGDEKTIFQGIFDGQGYVISNLTVSSYGLFGAIGNNGVVKNLGLYNIVTSGTHAVIDFGLAGFLFGKIENVSFVQDNAQDIGAVIGRSFNGSVIKDLVAYLANVKTENVGGLFNSVSGTSFTDYDNIYLVANTYNNNCPKCNYFNTATYKTDETFKSITFSRIFDCKGTGVWKMDQSLGLPLVIKKLVVSEKLVSHDGNINFGSFSKNTSLSMENAGYYSCVKITPNAAGWQGAGIRFSAPLSVTERYLKISFYAENLNARDIYFMAGEDNAEAWTNNSIKENVKPSADGWYVVYLDVSNLNRIEWFSVMPNAGYTACAVYVASVEFTATKT